MIPIPSKKQIAIIDQFTIQNGTSELSLIDDASNQFALWLIQRIPDYTKLAVLCGQGNNGADGFAVAKKLAQRGYQVTVLACRLGSKRSDSNAEILDSIAQCQYLDFYYIDGMDDILQLPESDILIDALFGNGISRPLSGLFKSLVDHVNEKYKTIYALDVPSGLLDNQIEQPACTFCKESYSFHFPRAQFFAPSNHKYVGSWSWGRIKLDEKVIEQQSFNTYLIHSSDAKARLTNRHAHSHKGKTGKVLHIVNLENMPGAGIIMTKAALKGGCGMSFVHCINGSNKIGLPIDSIEVGHLDEINNLGINCISIGPGLGRDTIAINSVDRILKILDIPLVLDADALNIIAEQNWHHRIPPNSILTPHIKEFERLFGESDGHFERINLQREISRSSGIYIILKGRYSSISDTQGNIYYNPTGNPSLARGGSGDVLTGILCALLAQNQNQFDTSIVGPFIHGLCADLFVQQEHEAGLDMSRLINLIPRAMHILLNHTESLTY